MKKSLKVTLIVVGVMALLAGGVALTGTFYLKKNAGRIEVGGEQVKIAAAAFGRGKNASACLRKALAVLDEGPGIVGEVKNGLFLRYCLLAADIPEEFCEGVPDDRSILATVVWRKDNCTAFGRGDDIRCSRLMGSVQDICHPYPSEVEAKAGGSGSLP